MKQEIKELLDHYKRGDFRALARLITLCENGIFEDVDEIVEEKGGQIVGITGSPGAGKSSIIDHLALRYVERGEKVAVLAIDPSSPFTHGAFLGDRVRMRRLSTKGVFIRSMASRDGIGGLASAVGNVLRLLSGFGFSRIFLETVGVGQAEVDIMNVADTVILTLSPGIGDEIQLLKAGVMEIADIYVINKADMEGAGNIRIMVETILSHEKSESDWRRRVVETSCMENRGFEELETAVNDHWKYLKESGELVKRQTKRRRYALISRFLQKIRLIVENADVERLTFDGLKRLLCDDIISVHNDKGG